jgi:hypothetical protein
MILRCFRGALSILTEIERNYILRAGHQEIITRLKYIPRTGIFAEEKEHGSILPESEWQFRQ